jgi:hypothetical protein
LYIRANGDMAKPPLDLFPRLLGGGFASLPEPVRRCHQIEDEFHAHGNFTITTGKTWGARLLARLMGMPPAGSSVLTHLDVSREDDALLWRRNFAGRRMDTRMYLLGDDRMAERKGLVELCFRLSIVDSGINYRSDGARICVGRLRIPFPSLLAPVIDGRAWLEPTRNVMEIRIHIASRLFGTIVSYEGPLEL